MALGSADGQNPPRTRARAARAPVAPNAPRLDRARSGDASGPHAPPQMRRDETPGPATRGQPRRPPAARASPPPPRPVGGGGRARLTRAEGPRAHAALAGSHRFLPTDPDLAPADPSRGDAAGHVTERHSHPARDSHAGGRRRPRPRPGAPQGGRGARAGGWRSLAPSLTPRGAPRAQPGTGNLGSPAGAGDGQVRAGVFTRAHTSRTPPWPWVSSRH